MTRQTPTTIGGYAMCDEADYSYSVYSERFPRARKEHLCYACREPIRVGDKYAYSVAIGEEGFDSYKHCLRCFTMLNAIFRERGSDIAVRWDLNCGEDWLDTIGELPDEIARLAFLTADEIQQLIWQKFKVSGPDDDVPQDVLLDLLDEVLK